MRNQVITTCLAVVLGAIPVTLAAPITAFFDDFTDGAIGTATGAGEVNGGFTVQGNGVGGTGTASEAGTIGTVTTATGANNSSSLSSVNSMNLAGLANGFTMTFVVDSIVGNPKWNGMFLGLANANTGDVRSAGNFGFNIDSDNAGTVGGVKLMSQDGPTSTRITVVQPVAAGTYTLAELQDGFTASFSVLPDNSYSYSITGLGADVSGSGTLSGTTYAAEFAGAQYVVAAVQKDNNDSDTVTINLDSVTVTSIPEPSTTLLCGLGFSFLLRRRRK